MAKRLGKKQVDLQPIGDAIREVQAKLRHLRVNTPNKVIKKRINRTIVQLNLLYAKANILCCDDVWGCPDLELPPDPGPPWPSKPSKPGPGR